MYIDSNFVQCIDMQYHETQRVAIASVGKLTCKLICKERCVIKCYICRNRRFLAAYYNYINTYYSLLQKDSEDIASYNHNNGARIRSQCMDMYINRQKFGPIQVWCYSQSSSTKYPTLCMTSEIDKTSNEFGDKPTLANRPVAPADWDTHYKRQQSTSWLDSRLQEHRERKVQQWT